MLEEIGERRKLKKASEQQLIHLPELTPQLASLWLLTLCRWHIDDPARPFLFPSYKITSVVIFQAFFGIDYSCPFPDIHMYANNQRTWTYNLWTKTRPPKQLSFSAVALPLLSFVCIGTRTPICRCSFALVNVISVPGTTILNSHPQVRVKLMKKIFGHNLLKPKHSLRKVLCDHPSNAQEMVASKPFKILLSNFYAVGKHLFTYRSNNNMKRF